MARAYLERGKRIPDWLGYLALLEEYALEWDDPKKIGKRPGDVIRNRDGWRCTAPGCVSRVLEVHHVRYRSRGGGDEAANLTSLCAFHHRMGEHGEWAQVRGTAPLGLIWRLGHPDLAVWYHNERRIEAPALPIDRAP